MLSDKEIQAIDLLKSYENKLVYEISEKDKKAVKTILNLIEKQSKEIEELEKQDLSNSKIIANMSTRHFNDREKIRKYEALQDKIKAKIEPILQHLERKMQEEYNKYGISREFQDVVDAYNFLQSLLEEE